MQFVLIRHSKTNPTADIPVELWGLTEEGILLTKALGQTAEVKSIDVLYSSLQTKALETALLLAKPNAIPIKTHSELGEVTSFTKKFLGNDYNEVVREYYSGRIERVHGGESKEEALDRFEQTLDEVYRMEQNNSKVGIVSHGCILSLFCAKYLNNDALFFHDEMQMPDVSVFDWNSKRFISLWKGNKNYD